MSHRTIPQVIVVFCKVLHNVKEVQKLEDALDQCFTSFLGFKQIRTHHADQLATGALDEVLPRFWHNVSSWLNTTLDLDSFLDMESDGKLHFLRIVDIALEVVVNTSGQAIVDWDNIYHLLMKLWLRIGRTAQEAQVLHNALEHCCLGNPQHTSQTILNAAYHFKIGPLEVLELAISRLTRCFKRLTRIYKLEAPNSSPLIHRLCDACSATLSVVRGLVSSEQKSVEIISSPGLRRSFRTMSLVLVRLLALSLSMAHVNAPGTFRVVEGCFTIATNLLDLIPDISFMLSALNEGLMFSVATVLKHDQLELGADGVHAMKRILTNILPRNFIYRSVVLATEKAMKATDVHAAGLLDRVNPLFTVAWNLFRESLAHSSCAMQYFSRRRREEEVVCGNVSYFCSFFGSCFVIGHASIMANT